MIVHGVYCDRCHCMVARSVREYTRVQLMDELQRDCGWSLGCRDAEMIGVKENPADLCSSCTGVLVREKRSRADFKAAFGPDEKTA